MKKRYLAPVVVLSGILLALSISFTMYLIKQPQDTRSRASASTTLSFDPSSPFSNPILKSVGDTVPLDIIINPGTNLVSFVKLQISYDPTKFTLDSNPFVTNIAAFPLTIEGPITGNGLLSISVSIGSDPSKVIRTTTKLGTINLKAIAPTTNNPTQVYFSGATQVLSSGQSEQAGENVLSNTIPAFINILPTAPTLTPTKSPTPTPSPTNVPTPTKTPTPTPIQPPGSTFLTLTIYQHGIWNSGDNTNPTQTDLSNKNPARKTINAYTELYNSSNQLMGVWTAPVTYSNITGNYKGQAEIDPATPLTSGQYTVRIKTDYHLKKSIQGFLNITANQTNIIPEVTLITGDANNDNNLSILDYNILLDCYSDLASAQSCNSANKIAADFNDDAKVNQIDYNLFIREITTLPGQ
jgi:hypothetical protein